MKVLVTGVKGQLGYDVCKCLDSRNIENTGVDIQDFDITDFDATMSFILNYKPDAVVHCSAYTQVDNAEDNYDLVRNVNAVGAENIAKVCKELDCKMVYISTDYVFKGVGTNAFEVDDETGPTSVYGKTKLEGENLVKSVIDKYFIVRISWVFGINGNNFINTMLRLGESRDELNVVCDQIGSPTYTYDLAPLLCDMIETEKYGIYHATNEGYTSWADFAEEIFNLAGLNVKVNHILSKDYPAKAERPLNSRLSKKSLDDGGFNRLPVWQDALKRYLKEKGNI